ncbi:MAG: hypothetical protein VW125_08740 [Flavobacteriaceae bacterium]|jgi:hypothetical protein
MARLVTIVFIISCLTALEAQDARGYGVGSNGVRSDSRLLDLFEDMKNKVTTQTLSVNQIKGSPYYDESFKLAEVEYFGKILEEKTYLRYNAFSDELEMVSNPQLKESETILIKNNKVACVIDGLSYRYLGYLNEDEPPAVGYVIELFKGQKIALYERNEKIYMEATQARTSLERSFPARFVDKKRFYIAIDNGSLEEVKLSKKKILTSLKNYNAEIKSFISETGTKLKNPEDVIELLAFLEGKI